MNKLKNRQQWLITGAVLLAIAGLAWAVKPGRFAAGMQMVPQSSWTGDTGVGGVYYKTGVGLMARNPNNTETGPLGTGGGGSTTVAQAYSNGASNSDETELITSTLGAHTLQANAANTGDLLLCEDSLGDNLVEVADNAGFVFTAPTPITGGNNLAFTIQTLHDLTSAGGNAKLVFKNCVSPGNCPNILAVTGRIGVSDLFMVDGSGDATSGQILAHLAASTTGTTLSGFDQTGSNVAGTPTTIRGGAATGNAATGDVVIQYAPPGSSGTTVQTPADAVVVSGTTGKATFSQGITTETWHEIGSGGEPAFLSSCSNFGAPRSTVAFARDAAGFLHLKGNFTAPLGSGSDVFTLPSGDRPLAELDFYVGAESAGGGYATARVKIATTGTITIFAPGNTANSLDGITFSVQ